MTDTQPIFTRLHLIRHGQTDWNKKKLIQGILDDIPLNAEGLQQAEATAQHLQQRYQVDVVYASQALRAQQTAEKISQLIQTNLHITGSLNEIDFGDFSGSTIFEIEEKFPVYFEAFRHFVDTNRSQGTSRPTIPNGESISQIEKRIAIFLSEVLSKQRGKQIAVVSHGSFIKCMLTHFSGESLHNYMPYWVENASISVVDLYGEIPVIRRLNDTSHLVDSRLDFAVPRVI